MTIENQSFYKEVEILMKRHLKIELFRLIEKELSLNKNFDGFNDIDDTISKVGLARFLIGIRKLKTRLK